MNSHIKFNTKKLIDNIAQLKKECCGIKFLFPTKCCTNKKILQIANKYLDGFDISNKNEYKLICQYVSADNKKIISSSGPLGFENVDVKNALIAVNSFNYYKKGFGLRINFNSFKNFEISHFGEDITSIETSMANDISYIHFHLADSRNALINNKILLNIKIILKKFPALKFLNIGGNLESLSMQDAILFLNRVRKIIPKHIVLIVEVGDLLFDGCGELFCKVIDTKIVNKKQIAILDVSKMANLRWSYLKYNENSLEEFETEFYGSTCCETDIVYKGRCHKLIIGEFIKFYNVSPYSYQWNKSFCGLNKIKIIFN